MDADQIDAVTALLIRAQEAHGTFEATELNGVYDQDWPRWYAVYVVDRGLGEMLGHDVTPDQVAQFLASTYAEFQQIDRSSVEPWAAYTARRIAVEL